MKTLPNYPSHDATQTFDGVSRFHQAANRSKRNRTMQFRTGNRHAADALPALAVGSQRLLTDEAIAEMAKGAIPNLGKVCQDLYHTFFKQGANNTALQFVPVLKRLTAFDRQVAERFMSNAQTNHVLVRHSLLKVVLIHWKPGQMSRIHGHAQGGCVFKVLQGSLEEKRYTPDESQRLLAVSTFQEGSMAYIDDEMAYHAVGNPFDTPAISLHVYTPGL